MGGTDQLALLRTLRSTSALALAAAWMAGCGGGDENTAPQGAVIDTVHVRAEDVPTLVQAVGTVEADNQTAVGAEVSGQVSRIIRDEGSRVAAGGRASRLPSYEPALAALAPRVARIALCRYHRSVLFQRAHLAHPLQPRLVAEALLADYRALFA